MNTSGTHLDSLSNPRTIPLQKKRERITRFENIDSKLERRMPQKMGANRKCQAEPQLEIAHLFIYF